MSKQQAQSLSPADVFVKAVNAFIRAASTLDELQWAIIYTDIAIELSVKTILAKSSPALIFDRIDDDGSNVFRELGVHGLPATGFVKTTSFENALVRYRVLKNIRTDIAPLIEIHQMRNGLVHFRTEFEVLRARRLLVVNAYPFLKEVLSSHWKVKRLLTRAQWRGIERARKVIDDDTAVSIQTLLARHESLAEELEFGEKHRRLASRRVLHVDETIEREDLRCPACQEQAMDCTLFVDHEPDGSSHAWLRYICRVCSLDLDKTDLNYIADNRERLEVDVSLDDLAAWKAALAVDEYSEFDDYDRDSDYAESVY